MTNSMRRIVGNAVSMLTSDVANRATTFVLYALVARYLGASEFGRLSLALTLFYTFQVLAVAGLKTLVTREVAKDRTKTDQYLVNGSVVVGVFSLLSIGTLLLFVRLMNYATDTATIILLLSLGLLPSSLSAVCEAVFQAWEQMRYIVYANVTVNVGKVALALLILTQDYGLYHLVILLLASYIAIVGLEWWLLFGYITRPNLRTDLHFSLVMTRATSTFLGIDGIFAIMSSLNIVLLSKLADETAVGLYSAAIQLTIPVMLVLQSIVLSVFPMMCRKFDPSFHDLKRIAEYLIALLLALALPMVVGLFFLADSALALLYEDNDFLLASGALRILVWILVMAALTNVLGQVLLASLREKVTLRIIAIDALVSLVLGVILISQFGLIGAALAALVTKIVDFLQHYLLVSKLLSGVALGRLLWQPVTASACMALYLAMERSQGIVLTAMAAGTIYAGVLLVLVIWSIGGPRQLRARYLYLQSE